MFFLSAIFSLYIRNQKMQIKLSLFGVLVMCFLLSACTKEPDKDKAPPSKLVKTMIVGSKHSLRLRSFPGKVVAGRKVDLAFQVPGQLIEFPVLNGQLVEKDQRLAKLDARDYQNRFDATEAELVKAEANYYRAEDLVSSGTIPIATYDDAKAKFDVARATRETALKALNDTNLLASFAGLVAYTYVENFENVLAKQNILSLQDISDVDIEISLPEQDLLLAGRGETVHGRKVEGAVVFTALPEREFNVTLKEYATEADPITQSFTVTFSMPNPDDVNIFPGMTATYIVETDLFAEHAYFLIPVSAVATDLNGQQYTWVVNSESMTVSKRPIKVADLSGSQIQVISGIKEGEEIVSAGVSYLSDGMKIRRSNSVSGVSK